MSEHLDFQFTTRFLKFTIFYPILGPLIFANFIPHFPKMLPTKCGSNQFSSFGEKSFKGRFTDGHGWRTGHDHYSSLEPSAQVN